MYRVGAGQAVYGEHKPSGCIVFAVLDTARESVWAWVATQGYERIPDDREG